MGHWYTDESGDLVHSEYSAIEKVYLPFKEFTRFLNKGSLSSTPYRLGSSHTKHRVVTIILLFTVMTRMTESDRNKHLGELQLMLNFNDFYSQSAHPSI